MPAERETSTLHTARHVMPFGAELEENGGVRFRLFAPSAPQVSLAICDADAISTALAMRANGDGWHELSVASAGGGTRYLFELPDGTRVPDPASRFQPEGVDGPSEVIDPGSFCWADESWRGRAWREAVLYELHIGTFTPEGTLRAAIEKLEYLAETGVTAIELMCVNAFAGQRSWGYDGVLLFAPDDCYGRPEDLKAFVDAAHARGLMVILDVVYNHFGPQGNYLPRYFPQIFSAEHKTAWGSGLNFDGLGSHEVRELIVHNALYWLEEFRMDGLRLDASHALIDCGPRHILDELADRIHAAMTKCPVHLILENEQTIGRLLTRRSDGEPVAYTAQWNHAVDHILGFAMHDEGGGDEGAGLHETEELGKALAEGFVAGDLNCPPPDASLQVPPTAYVSFIQTHDLVGNRVFGERLHALAPREAVRAIAAVYLLLPQAPMLFMGEEWAATTPFLFFCDYRGHLAITVQHGRVEQLKKDAHASKEELKNAPDPEAESTFLNSKLDWSELENPQHAEQLAWYRRILALRQREIVPLLSGLTHSCGRYEVLGPGQLRVEWNLARGVRLALDANLCSGPSSHARSPLREVLWLEGSEMGDGRLGAWSVRWSVLDL